MANHRIAPELRERAIMHLMPPYNWSLRQVADDIGVGIATVHGWRKQLELEGLIIRKVEPGAEQSAEQIFTILLETASLSEHELSEYCRKNGLYPEHIAEWKQNCLTANQPKHRQLVDEQTSNSHREKPYPCA